MMIKTKIILMALLLSLIVGCGSNLENQGEKMENKIVVFETNMGNFEIELDEEKAPVSVKNFLEYVNEGFYDGTIFHRVINNFMVQGGGFDKDMNEKQTKAPIKNEAGNGLKNEKYTVAMARTNVVDSATSQFFINVNDNGFLNHRDESAQGFGYAVFGKVVSGMEVIDAMKIVETGNQGFHQDVPVEPIVVTKAFVK